MCLNRTRTGPMHTGYAGSIGSVMVQFWRITACLQGMGSRTFKAVFLRSHGGSHDVAVTLVILCKWCSWSQVSSCVFFYQRQTVVPAILAWTAACARPKAKVAFNVPAQKATQVNSAKVRGPCKMQTPMTVLWNVLDEYKVVIAAILGFQWPSTLSYPCFFFKIV